MKKIHKKIIAIALAAVMTATVATTGFTAFAAENSNAETASKTENTLTTEAEDTELPEEDEEATDEVTEEAEEVETPSEEEEEAEQTASSKDVKTYENANTASGDFTYSVIDNEATITSYTGSDTDVVVPSMIDDYNVAAIGDYAFYNQTSMKSIVIPVGVRSINDKAFKDCSSLQYVFFTGPEERWNIISFGNENEPLRTAIKHYNCDTHTYVTQKDKNKHWDECSVCHDIIDEEQHVWNSGKITKAATCAATGVKTYTCSCGMTKTETLPKTTTHKWNSGTIIKQPTYTSTGVKVYTCTVCKTTKQQTIAKKVLGTVKITNAVNTANGIQIKWNKVADAQGYRIYRKKVNGKYQFVKVVNANTTSYLDTSVDKDNGYKFTYIVRAYRGKVYGPYKERPIHRLVQPTITDAYKKYAKTLSVRWTQNTKATAYQVLYRLHGDSKYKIITVNGNANIYRHIKNLLNNKTYRVYVRSVRTVGSATYYSAWSDGRSVEIAPKTGLYTEDGRLFFYKNDVKQEGTIKYGTMIFKTYRNKVVYYVQNVAKVFDQFPELPTGCEITAWTIMANYAGVDIDKTTAAEIMPKADSPYFGFTGNPFTHDGVGMVIYPEGLRSMTEEYLHGFTNLTGASFDEIKEKLNQKHLVMAWILVSDGTISHTLTLTGYDHTGFFINNPATGEKEHMDYDEFEYKWSINAKRAMSY